MTTEMKQEFQIGDTVRLKSGGPLMTVVSLGHGSGLNQQVDCQWFVANKSFSGAFPAAAIEKDDDSMEIMIV